ncbi:zincin-like metallopeptidase domain-containing protein [Pseudomonas lurida]|uniref:zincin-like metallopeptidase domain-containing protein n=1 Tax=Pseudomonas lurida TaxID=244566 RepID=UPI002736A663|nr:zincin-like metallopeptidase domain-containing protein [Pseudomonas lurida]WLG29645.1 zincin-like metallopeptidase domain-containing protein [Pseudomonas lurida]
MALLKQKSYKEKKEYIDNSKEKLEGFLADKVDSIHAMLKSENPDVPVWNSPCFKIRYLNPVSGTIYNLENSMLLSMLGKEKGFELPYYLTAKQGYDAGLSNKGEKGDFVVHHFGMQIGFVKDGQKPGSACNDDQEPNAEGKAIYRRGSKLSPVFNLQQFTGELPNKINAQMAQRAKIPTPSEVKAVLQSVMDTMPTPLKRHAGAEHSNYFSPGEDTIHMAPSSYFKSELHELSTLLHEVSHSYGVPSRKNRESLAKYAQSDEHRAYEELVANLSAQAVIKHLNFNITDGMRDQLDDAFFKNHQTYDVGWALKGLRDKPDQVFKAAADADRTANEIIYKLENNLKAKYELDPTLPVSDFIKQRLSRSEVDSTPQVKPPTISSHDIQVETATPIQQQKKRTLKI